MKRIKSIHISLILLAVIFSGVVFVSTVLVKNRIIGQSGGDKLLQVNEHYSSNFMVVGNDLNIIILNMKNPNIINSEEFIITLEDEGGHIERQMVFNGANIGDPSDIRFQFEPLKDSNQKGYNLVVRTKKSKYPVAIRVNDDDEVAYKAYRRSANKVRLTKLFIGRIADRVVGDLTFFFIWGAILAFVFRKYRSI